MGMFSGIINLMRKKRRPKEETDTEEEDEIEHNGLGSSIERREYSSQELNFLSDIASSDFLYGVATWIEQYDGIREEFKDSLIVALCEILGRDELYANNNPQHFGKTFTSYPTKINAVEAEIVLWMTVTDATKCDLQNFNLVKFIKIIMKDYKALQTRTIGKATERDKITELKSTVTSLHGMIEKEDNKKKEEKKNWLGF